MTNFSVTTNRTGFSGRDAGPRRPRPLGFARLAGGVFLGVALLTSACALFSSL